jgi:F-type H+-transporting ATPase subunit b
VARALVGSAVAALALLVAAPALAGGGEGPHVNWFGLRNEPHTGPGFIWALFNFGVFFALLVRFAGPPIAGFVRTRHDQMRQDLDEARRLLTEAQARVAEYEGRLANIDREIAGLLAGMRAEAEAEKERAIAAGLEAAQRLRKETEFTVEQERKRVLLEFEREIVDRAIEVARRLLSERAGDADHRALAERFAREIAPPSSGTPAPPAPPPAAPPARAVGGRA